MRAFKLSIALLFFLFALPKGFSEEKPLPELCKTACVSTFGKELGKTADGILAYSNCRPDCIYESPVMENGTYTGIRWQCVEFARRWLLKHEGAVFASVDFAYEIWSKIEALEKVPSKEKIPLINIPNGAPEIMKRGDLLVYAREYQNTGHIAVVLSVDRKRGVLRVAEENFLNQPWPGDYSREIAFIKRGGKYWLLDPFILGWKRADQTGNAAAN